MIYLLIFISILFEIAVFYYFIPKLGLLKAMVVPLIGNIVGSIVGSLLIGKLLIGWQHIFRFSYGSESFKSFLIIILLIIGLTEYIMLRFIFKYPTKKVIFPIVLTLLATMMLQVAFYDPSQISDGELLSGLRTVDFNI